MVEKSLVIYRSIESFLKAMLLLQQECEQHIHWNFKIESIVIYVSVPE